MVREAIVKSLKRSSLVLAATCFTFGDHGNVIPGISLGLQTRCDLNPQVERSERAVALAKSYKLTLTGNTPRVISEDKSNGLRVLFCHRPSTQGISRMGQIEIQSPIESVENLIMNHSSRKDWDSDICGDTKIINSTDNLFKLNYFKSKSRIFPQRDFVYSVHKIPGSIIGSNFHSVAIINLDASSYAPTSWFTIRGKYDSLILLEPMGSKSTKVTYVVDIDPRGLSALFYFITSSVMGNNILNSLIRMKKTLEVVDDVANDTNLSVEEAAKKIFQRRLDQEKEEQIKSLSAIENVAASKDDLNSLVISLEKRLKQLKTAQSAGDLDLSELIHRVERDLEKSRDKLGKL